LGLQRRFRPRLDLNDEEQESLARVGLNALIGNVAGKCRLTGSATMGRGSEAHAKFSKLGVRRSCLKIINTIAKATRWAVFETEDKELANRLRGQVLTYLSCLNDLGAFANEDFLVQCDAGVSNRTDGEERGITILLMFHPVDCDEPISLTLHQTASGYRVGSTAFGLTIRQSVS
jgi:phage tail sheath protein FI